MPESRARRSLKPAIWMILVTALLDMMAMGIVMPVLPGLVEQLTGSLSAAGRWTGIIGSLWALMQFLSAAVIGGLSDSHGRRPVILVSTAGLALDWVVMALAPNLWWLVLGRIIGGVTSASATALFAYMADITSPDKRARAFGLVGAVASAGFVAGPALGGVLGGWGPRLPFWVAAALSSTAFLYGLFVLPESLPPERRMAFAWRRANPVAALGLLRLHHGLLGLAAGGFLLTFAQRLFMTVFVLFAGHRHHLAIISIGALLAFSSVLDLLMQGVVVGPATARFGDRRVMVFGLTGMALSLLAMGFAPSAAWFVVAMIPSACGGLAEPTIRSLMSRRVPETAQGRLQGAVQSLASIAGIAGPVFFGWIYGLSSLAMPGLSFLIAAGILFVAALCSAGATQDRVVELPHQ